MITTIAIIFILSIVGLYALFRPSEDLTFNAKDTNKMVSSKTKEKQEKRLKKLLEKEEKEDERHYKMLKKMIAKEAKKGGTSLLYSQSYIFNDVISYRVRDRLRKEGFRVKEYENKYKVRNGLGNTWEETEHGFWVFWD